MANRTISEFPVISELQDTDLILISTGGKTYTVPALLFKESAREALYDEINILAEQIADGNANIQIVNQAEWGSISGDITEQTDLQSVINQLSASISQKANMSDVTSAISQKANASDVADAIDNVEHLIPTNVSELTNDSGYIQNGTTGNVLLGGEVAISGTNALFKVVEVSATVTGGSGDRNQTLNQAVNPGTGWTPVGVVGAYSSVTTFYIFRAYLNGDNVIVGARYTADSTSTTATLRAYVLCLRTNTTIDSGETPVEDEDMPSDTE